MLSYGLTESGSGSFVIYEGALNDSATAKPQAEDGTDMATAMSRWSLGVINGLQFLGYPLADTNTTGDCHEFTAFTRAYRRHSALIIICRNTGINIQIF
jgi:hypothetical protein